MQRTLQSALLAACLGCVATPALAVNPTLKLADIVGGGNGLGTGTIGAGINPANGSTTPPAQFQISQPDNTNSYHSSPVKFVDGVFIPDGGAGAVTLDSAHDTFAGFPNTDSNSWDMVKDGPNQNSGTTLNGVDYDSGTHTMIGLHANKGITFDLRKIEAAYPGTPNAEFTAIAGLTHVGGGYGTADWWVFLDGKLEQSEINSPGGVGFKIDVTLGPTSHFLTLVSTDDGDGFNADQIIFGDPILRRIATPLNLDAAISVPEPSSVWLLGAALVALAAWAGLRRTGAWPSGSRS